MALAVCMGAMLQCSFGAAPSSLVILPTNRCVEETPLATIMDFIPMTNIMPFGMCDSMSNPEVAAATAAALGVLTPMPCEPVTTAPWVVGAPNVILSVGPVLDNSAKLMCAWGGVIQIVSPGQTAVQVP